MVGITNAKLIFNEIPTGYPEPGKTTITDTSENIDLDNVPLNGGFLLKILALSIDPYLRGRMRDPSVESYAPAFSIGKPIDNHGVAVVLRSENDAVKVGQHLFGILEFTEYAVRKDLTRLRVLPENSGLPWSVYLGAAGMPGKTAYMAWKEYSHAKKGETTFISTGAGPVGSLVIQLAKQDGQKVIASAGSDEKVKFMKEVGADVAFNYKTTSVREVLEKEGPIDIYWDNVAGETLEAALDNFKTYGRIISCGSISGYNESSQGVRNLEHIYGKSLTMTGFIVLRMQEEHDEEFYKVIPPQIAAGKLKYREHKYHGLDSAGQAILDVQTGANTAKAVIIVAEE